MTTTATINLTPAKQAATLRRAIRWMDREIAQCRKDAADDWDSDRMVRAHFSHLKELQRERAEMVRALEALG